MVSVVVARSVGRVVIVSRRVGELHMFCVGVLRLFLWPIFL